MTNRESPREDEPSFRTCKERTKFPPITLDKGAIYEGEWLLGMRDGIGKQVWPDGSMYCCSIIKI